MCCITILTRGEHVHAAEMAPECARSAYDRLVAVPRTQDNQSRMSATELGTGVFI